MVTINYTISFWIGLRWRFFCDQKYVTTSQEVRCSHQGTDVNHCSFYQDTYQINDINWLKCPICSVWFHENSFYLQLWSEYREIYRATVKSGFQPLTYVTKNSCLDVAGVLQSWKKYLRQALVFMWNSALRENFNFCISGVFC